MEKLRPTRSKISRVSDRRSSASKERAPTRGLLLSFSNFLSFFSNSSEILALFRSLKQNFTNIFFFQLKKIPNFLNFLSTFHFCQFLLLFRSQPKAIFFSLMSSFSVFYCYFFSTSYAMQVFFGIISVTLEKCVTFL